MKEKVKRYPNPQFHSLEEEEKYWETHSPLAEGYEGKIQRSSQKRSSFLAVRLTGEELTRLRDIAGKRGLGPSTFARIVLTSAVEQEHRLPKTITLEQLKDAIEQNLPQPVKDKAESLAKDMVIGDPDNPPLLLMDTSQMKRVQEFTWSLLRALLSMAGVRVIMPEDERYEKLRDMVKTRD